jgi:hypothetical protein
VLFLVKMDEYLKNQNSIRKVLAYLKALFCRNLALEYHKVTPQSNLGVYMRSYTNFKRLIWTMRIFVFLAVFSVISILNLANLHISSAASSINISGVAYQDLGKTPIDGSSINKTVNLRVEGTGSYSDTITTSDGAWSITGVSVNSGDVVLVYLDNEAEEATTVYISDETSQTDVDLYKNYVIVRADTGTIGNGDLATADDEDDDVKYYIQFGHLGGYLNMDSNFNLYVWPGTEHQPGGPIVTLGSGGIRIGDGSILNTTNDVEVADDWKNEGTYTNGTNETIFKATSSASIDNSEADSAAGADFYDLTIGDGSGTSTLSSDFSLDVDNDLTITDGTLDMQGVTTWYLTDDTDGAAANNRRMKSEDPAGTLSDTALCWDGQQDFSGWYCRIKPRGTSQDWLTELPTDIQQYGYMLNDGNPMSGTFSSGTWRVDMTVEASWGWWQYTTQDVLMRIWKAAPDFSTSTPITGWSRPRNPFSGEGVFDIYATVAGAAFEMDNEILTVELMVFIDEAIHLVGSGGSSYNIRVNEGGSKQKVSTTATFTPDLNIGGNFDNNDTFTHRSGKVIFDAADAGNTIEAGSSDLYDAVFQGGGGDGTWNIQTDNIAIANTLDVDAGDTLDILSGRVATLNKTSGSTLTLDGTINGSGRLDYKTSTAFPTTGTIDSNLRFDSSSNNQTMSARTYGGNVEVFNSGALSNRTVTLDNGTVNVTGSLYLNADDTTNITLDGSSNNPALNVTGDLDFIGTGLGNEIHDPGEQTITVSGDVNFSDGSFNTGGGSTLQMNGTGKTLTLGGNSLEKFNVTGGNVSLGDALDISNDLSIDLGTFNTSGNDINIAGSWNNDSTFTHGNAKVTFDSTNTGETIESGASAFYDVEFNHVNGGWTTQTDNVTVANDLDLTNASAFIVESGRTVEVQGNFTNAVGGANTTWTGSTLYLNDTSELDTINTKTGGSDDYGTLRIGADDGIGMWNSNASTITIDSGACLESFDHNSTDGQLNIYGSCNSRSNEYWSYTTDFDGTSLSGGNERQASIKLSADSSFTVDQGNSLLIQGQSAVNNRTEISRLGSGNYNMNVAGIISARYYDFDYLNSSGLNITSTATVSELSDGTFDNIGSGTNPSYITVAGISSTDSFSNMVFDSATDGTDSNAFYNVNADGSGIDWTFVQSSGNKNGEDNDNELNGASVQWTIYFSGINDGLSSDSDVTNSTTQLSANWSTITDDDIEYFTYAIGTTSGGSGVVGYTSIGVSTNFTRTGLTLSNGTTYYTTVRAYDSSDELLESITSDGITVDTITPTFSSIVTDSSAASFTVSWTSSEPATSNVHWGLTDSYGNITVGSTERATNHEVTVSGLSDNTAYHFMLTGTDAAGNTAETSDQTVTTQETTSTVITNVQITNITVSSVKVTWTTNHAADSKVRYGLTTDYGDEEYDSELVTSHEIEITELTPNTQYHYEVLSTGNSVAIDADATFTTLEEEVPEEDPIPPPTPTILSPESNTTVNTTRPLITGLAESNNDIFILVDQELIAVVKAKTHTSGTGDFHYQLEEPLLFGEHNVIVRARDNSGLVSSESDERVFSVDPPYPTPTLQTPVLHDGDDLRVTIPGLAINGTLIRIYINGVITHTFTVSDDDSGTANFNALVDGLSFGANIIEIDAVGLDGKISEKTDPLTVTINESEQQITKYELEGDTVQTESFYEVSEGDSLWSIAEQFYCDGRKWIHIHYANQEAFPSLKENPSIIRSRWKLKIPTL